MPSKKRFVMVTTEHKGVFAGTLVKYDSEHEVAVIKDARMLVYWSSDTRGVLGAAAKGPGRSCRVSPAVPKIQLNAVTSVIDCTDNAKAMWEAEPWS